MRGLDIVVPESRELIVSVSSADGQPVARAGGVTVFIYCHGLNTHELRPTMTGSECAMA
jgi:hypothetical protein